MSKKYNVPSLKELEQGFEELINIAKKFDEFNIPQNIKEEGEKAVKLARERKVEQAVLVFAKAKWGLQNLLSAYLRKSFIFFDRLRSRLERRLVLDKDIAKRLDNILIESKSLMFRLLDSEDIPGAQELYFATMEAINSVEAEQRTKNEERRKRIEKDRQETEAIVAAKQRAQEQERCDKIADNLQRIVSLM